MELIYRFCRFETICVIHESGSSVDDTYTGNNARMVIQRMAKRRLYLRLLFFLTRRGYT